MMQPSLVSFCKELCVYVVSFIEFERYYSMGAHWVGLPQAQRPMIISERFDSKGTPPFFLSLCRFKGLKCNSPDYLSFNDLYWSSDLEEVCPKGLPRLSIPQIL